LNTAKTSGKWFMAIIVMVHMVFFLLACQFTRIYMGDSFEYIYEAVNIKDKLFFYSGNPALKITEEYMTQRQPIYPLFLCLVYLFSVNNWIVLVLQNVLSVFNIWYCRQGLFKMGYHSKYDWLLLLFIVAYPIQFIYANTIAPEILLQTSVLIYMRQMVLMIMHRKWEHVMWASLSLIFGLFVKPVLYPFVIVHLIIVLIWAGRNKMHWLRAAGIGVLPLLAVLLYNAWNYQRTDKFHFSSNQGFNAIYYYYYYFAEKEGGEKAQQFLQNERDKIASFPLYKDRYDYANKRGVELLKENFTPYMTFHLKNSARFFIEPGKGEIDLFTGKLTYGGLYNTEGEGFYATYKKKGIEGLPGYAKKNPSLLIALLILVFNLFRLSGMLMALFDRRILLPVRLYVFVMFGYFAITTGPIANTHYFMPISLVAMGSAVVGFIHWREKKANLASQRV
jgi:hypothetical protein